MTASYFILQPDGTQTGPVPQAQVLAYLHAGVLQRESLVRRADLAEFFAISSYPEFAQTVAATPSAVARGPQPSVIARPGVPRKGKPKAEEPVTGRWLLWLMVLFLLVMLGWGVRAGLDKWQENAEAQKQVAAEQWRNANLPEYRVVDARKRLGEVGSLLEHEVVFEGAVEEKEAKRHPEYGRSERKEVYVRLALWSDLTGEIRTVPIPLETVLIKDGKGTFTVRRMVPIEALEGMDFERVSVRAEVKYEK